MKMVYNMINTQFLTAANILLVGALTNDITFTFLKCTWHENDYYHEWKNSWNYSVTYFSGVFFYIVWNPGGYGYFLQLHNFHVIYTLKVIWSN